MIDRESSLKSKEIIKLFEFFSHSGSFALETEIVWLQKILSVSIKLVSESFTQNVVTRFLYFALAVSGKEILLYLCNFFLDINFIKLCLEKCQAVCLSKFLCLKMLWPRKNLSFEDFSKVAHSLIVMVIQDDFKLPE